MQRHGWLTDKSKMFRIFSPFYLIITFYQTQHDIAARPRSFLLCCERCWPVHGCSWAAWLWVRGVLGRFGSEVYLIIIYLVARHVYAVSSLLFLCFIFFQNVNAFFLLVIKSICDPESMIFENIWIFLYFFCIRPFLQ